MNWSLRFKCVVQLLPVNSADPAFYDSPAEILKARSIGLTVRSIVQAALAQIATTMQDLLNSSSGSDVDPFPSRRLSMVGRSSAKRKDPGESDIGPQMFYEAEVAQLTSAGSARLSKFSEFPGFSVLSLFKKILSDRLTGRPTCAWH